MEVRVLGIDLAKDVFQLYGVDARGRTALTKRLRRPQLAPFVAALPPCLIGLEACASAFHWARQFQRQGHMVRIISPQFVKPFIRGNKNDGNDAAAICEAVQRPNMRFVPLKSIEQQDVQSLHRARQRLVNHRTALISQMRGILLDRGIVFPKSATRARRLIPLILSDPSSDLSPLVRQVLTTLLELFRDLDARVKGSDRQIAAVFTANPVCQRIAQVEGVGPKTATALVAAVGNGQDFKNGRHMAAWLGLVPRHRASGDRITLGSISKRGDQHLRTLLVHGARAVVRTAGRKTDAKSQWVNALVARRGVTRAIVAVANKNARILWVLLAREQDYRRVA
jgi:transposase